MRLLAGLSVLFVVDVLNAQVAGRCDNCRIQLQRELEIGGQDASFSLPTPIVRNSKGFLVLVDRAPNGGVMLFGPNGGLIKKLNVLGDGKGDRANHVSAMAVGPGDSLHLFGSHHTVLDHNLRFARVTPLQNQIFAEAAVLLPTGDALVNAAVRTRDLAGLPLHSLDNHGNRIRSFGFAPTDTYTGSVWSDRRIIGVVRAADGIWSLRMNDYVLEKWGFDGQRTLVTVLKSNWFKRWSAWDGRIERTPPPPRVASVHEDKAGRVWVLTLVASSKWTPQLGRDSSSTSGVPVEVSHNQFIENMVFLNDSMVEVFDPKDGVLLASIRLTGFYEGFVGDDFLAQVTVPPGSATARLVLWRVNIKP